MPVTIHKLYREYAELLRVDCLRLEGIACPL